MATLIGNPPDAMHRCPACGAHPMFIHGFGRNGRVCDACDGAWDAEELGWRVAQHLLAGWRTTETFGASSDPPNNRDQGQTVTPSSP